MKLTQSFQGNTKQLGDCLLLLMEADWMGVMDGWMDRVKSGKPLFQSFLFIWPDLLTRWFSEAALSRYLRALLLY